MGQSARIRRKLLHWNYNYQRRIGIWRERNKIMCETIDPGLRSSRKKKLFSFVLPLDIYSLGLIAMVDEGYNHRYYGEHVASKFDVENMNSAYSVDPPSDFPNYAGGTRRAEAAQGLFAPLYLLCVIPIDGIQDFVSRLGH
jgi:hypothetical protein